MYRRLLLALGLCLHISAFATLPGWVEQPEPDTREFIFALGVGEDYEQAKASALAELAGFFTTEVQQRFMSKERFNDGELSVSADLETQATVVPSVLSDFEVTRTTRVDDDYWVEIRLHREAFAQSMIARWRSLAATVDVRLNALGSPIDVLQRDRIEQALTDVLRAQKLLAQAMAASNDLRFAEEMSAYQTIRHRLTSALLDRDLMLHCEEQDVRQLLGGILIRHGFRLLDNPSDSTPRIEAEATIRDSESAGAIESRLEVDIRVVDANGKEVGNSTFRTRGRSYEGDTMARHKALTSFRIRIEELSVAELLGLAR